MSKVQWHRLERVDDLKTKPLQQIHAGEVVLALSYRDGEFGAISGRCNHAGGPLGNGHLDADGYVVCPWHHWHFHRLTGQARPGIPAAVPRNDLKIVDGDLFVNLVAATQRINAPHPAHRLTRPILGTRVTRPSENGIGVIRSSSGATDVARQRFAVHLDSQ